MPTTSHRTAQLHYEQHGTGDTRVLFIQGVGIIGNGWKPQIDALQGRCAAVTFDNRGIGRSTAGTEPLSIELMAEDAAAVARAAGWDRYHVVGHSMGGVIAQRLALTAPGAVRSLSLLCTVSRGIDAVNMSVSTLVTALRSRIGTRTSRRRAFLKLVYPQDLIKGRDTDALARELEPLFGRDLADQPPILMKQAMALRAHDSTRELARLGGIPTIVVSAELDTVTPAWCGRGLAAAIPGAVYHEVRGAAHGLPIHSPGVVNELLLSHFARSAG